MKVREMDEQAWREWVDTRPPVVKAICERLPPDRLYELSPTGQRVTLEAYAEDGTLRVYVDPDYNEFWRFTGHQVFGINPDDLKECDVPSLSEAAL
jgi:hypothetical protein